MSDNKFTKGEWFVVERDNEITVTCEDYDIFTCWTDAHDAGLVSAAPEMYETLEKIMRHLSNGGGEAMEYLNNSDYCINMILKKARGENV
jgi:hypothetical protein